MALGTSSTSGKQTVIMVVARSSWPQEGQGSRISFRLLSVSRSGPNRPGCLNTAARTDREDEGSQIKAHGQHIERLKSEVHRIVFEQAAAEGPEDVGCHSVGDTPARSKQ